MSTKKIATPFILTNALELHNGAETLSGIILRINKNDDGHFAFSEYFTRERLWYTTTGEWCANGDESFTLQTANTLYRFTIVRLPDSVKELANNVEPEIPDPEDETNIETG